MEKFIVGIMLYFSIGTFLYILSCIKYKKIYRYTYFMNFIKMMLLAPFLIIWVIWDDL